MTDPELKAMQVLLEKLGAFDQATIGRILVWVADRYGVDLRTLSAPAKRDSPPGRTRSQARADEPGKARDPITAVEIEALLRSA